MHTPTTKSLVITGLALVAIAVLLVMTPARPTPVAEVPMGKLPAGSPASGAPEDLLGTWVWQYTIMQDSPQVDAAKPGVFTLRFDADNRVSATTDCNGFGGEYTRASDGIITMGPLMSTMMYCEGSQEDVFRTQVAAAELYAFDMNGNLVLSTQEGSGSMIFVRK